MKGARVLHEIIRRAKQYGLGGLKVIRDGVYTSSSIPGVEFWLGEHARGRTFNIYLVDGDDKLQVYGAVSGQLGWDEEYEWKYMGEWVEPITRYFHKLQQEIAANEEMLEAKKRKEERENQRKLEEKIQRFNELWRGRGLAENVHDASGNVGREERK